MTDKDKDKEMKMSQGEPASTNAAESVNAASIAENAKMEAEQRKALKSLPSEPREDSKALSEQRSKNGRKKGRRAHLTEFSMNLNGEYVYRGNCYTIEGDKMEKKSKGSLRKLLVVCVAMLAMTAVIGSVPAEAAVKAFYVILPLAFQCIFMLRLVWIVGRAYYHGLPLREYVYTKTVKKFRVVSMILFTFACVTFVCWSVFTVLNGLGKAPIYSVIFAVIQAFNLATMRLFIIMEKNISWKQTH